MSFSLKELEAIEARQKRLNDLINPPALRAIRPAIQALEDMQLQQRRIAAMCDPFGARFTEQDSTKARTTRVEKVVVESPEPCEPQEQKPALSPAKGFKSEVWDGSRGECQLHELVRQYRYLAYSKDRTEIKFGITETTHKQTVDRYRKQGFVIAAFEPCLNKLDEENKLKDYLELNQVPETRRKSKKGRRGEYLSYNEGLEALRRYGNWPMGSLASAPRIEGVPYQTDLFLQPTDD